MSKLIMMQGLPASGKSTKAAELLKEYGNAIRINRDLLRTMLHCDVWSTHKETATREAAMALARWFLSEASHSAFDVVIVDDTNLNALIVASWQECAQICGASFEIWHMDTTLEECLLRDACRKKSVGKTVIVGMALQYGLYPQPEKGMVLVDIDGTIADCTHRRKYVAQEPKEWDRFFGAMEGDRPRHDVIQQVTQYWREGHEVFLVSGRPDDYRQQTEDWVAYYCPFQYRALFMRRAGDHRPDTDVKEQILQTYFPDTSWIHCAIDDRPSIVRLWQSHGIQTIDVGDGREF